MEPNCKPLPEVLDDLQEISGDAPFLALGQTVFWDEPMKGGIALAARRLGKARRMIAGVHDTDYFAKLPSGPRRPGRFTAVPHNDTTTKGLWSAAGEFSALFGSETVVTRELLTGAGLRVEKLEEARPKFLDEATEAWGWRGIVSLDETAPITADVLTPQILSELKSTLNWALETSLETLNGQSREMAQKLADELHTAVCEAGETSRSVADLYEKLIPILYNFASNASVPLETSRTTELLKFNLKTCGLPRFELLSLFVQNSTRAVAKASYDESIHRAQGLYELARFGTGAIPFDLVIPGEGRGTIRIGNRGIVIMTPKPKFISLRKPLESICEFAELIESKFGTECAVVGKAVTLIGMLAREFVFVFHEGASSYVKHSRQLHRLLAERGHVYQMHPILRVRYDAWSALRVCCSWLRLPTPLQRAFGTEELCAPSFASRWAQVASEQRSLLERLSSMRRPVDLIRFLDLKVGGAWSSLAEEYDGLRARLDVLHRDLSEVREERKALYDEIRALRRERGEREAARGEHWRQRLFEKNATEQDLLERERLGEAIEEAIHARTTAESHMHELRRRQNELVSDPEVRKIHDRRRSIELEAELKRLRLIREAVLASRGLDRANLRPSAWWFRLVCPDGLWFRETLDTAEVYLEPLV